MAEKIKILLIEDDNLLIRMYQEKFNRDGFDVQVADGGEDEIPDEVLALRVQGDQLAVEIELTQAAVHELERGSFRKLKGVIEYQLFQAFLHSR